MSSPRPIIVLGSPRSGTTLLGAFLGTVPDIADIGEYAGYDFCYRIAANELLPMPAKGMREYVKELQMHAHDFPRRLAGNAAWFVVSAPWNLLVAWAIAEQEPTAVFVLCLRRLEGVCQSLERSYLSGRKWAGSDVRARIDLWCDFYENALKLPLDRTIIVDYDVICEFPELETNALKRDLLALEFPADFANPEAFAKSHATFGTPRPTLARVTPEGTLVWNRRASWNPHQWTSQDQAVAASHDRYQKLAAQIGPLLVKKRSP